jgi:hypothetical protein
VTEIEKIELALEPTLLGRGGQLAFHPSVEDGLIALTFKFLLSHHPLQRIVTAYFRLRSHMPTILLQLSSAAWIS